MLEGAQYEDNAFVTLTYDDEHLPVGGSLEPKHFQDFLKRLRFAIAPVRIRYFGVGEYGDTEFRPHYHAALFGFPSCRYGISRFKERSGSCCVSCDVVQRSWGMGIVMLGTLEQFSAQYIAGYVTKKMTMWSDPRLKRSDGTVLHPEFSRMSLRPGIGCDAMDEVASELMRFNLDETQGDVPFTLRHGKKEWPLGKYLRRQLRARIGKDEVTPKEVQLEASKELLPLLQESVKNATSFKSEVLKKFEGKRNSFHARQKIFKQRRRM